MITIPQAHYDKLIETVQIFHKNIGILFPNQTDIAQLYAEWKKINEELSQIHKKVHKDLSAIYQSNASLARQNQELNDKITNLSVKNEELLKSNTIQRAQLAKNLAEYSKLKEIAKAMKASLKDKEQALKQKNEMLEEAGQKSKKYKKMYQEQVKRVEKLDKMIAVLEVTQRSSAKEKELDQQMQQLQAELENMQSYDN